MCSSAAVYVFLEGIHQVSPTLTSLSYRLISLSRGGVSANVSIADRYHTTRMCGVVVPVIYCLHGSAKEGR